MAKEIITIKIGGILTGDTDKLEYLAYEINHLWNKYYFLIVHGGGNEITEVAGTFGIQPVFKDGIRMTSETEMDVVEMVLGGKVNKSIVAQINQQGGKAVGLSGKDGGLILASAQK